MTDDGFEIIHKNISPIILNKQPVDDIMYSQVFPPTQLLKKISYKKKKSRNNLNEKRKKELTIYFNKKVDEYNKETDQKIQNIKNDVNLEEDVKAKIIREYSSKRDDQYFKLFCFDIC